MIKTWTPRLGACLLLTTTALVSMAPAAVQAQAAARDAFDNPAAPPASTH